MRGFGFRRSDEGTCKKLKPSSKMCPPGLYRRMSTPSRRLARNVPFTALTSARVTDVAGAREAHQSVLDASDVLKGQIGADWLLILDPELAARVDDAVADAIDRLLLQVEYAAAADLAVRYLDGANGGPGGLSAPINVIPLGASSWPCMMRLASEPSCAMPPSP